MRTDRNGVEYYLYASDGEPLADAAPTEEQWRETPAAPEHRDRTYRVLCAALPLEPEHLQNLRARGLPGEWIERAGYSTLPGDEQRPAVVRTVRAEAGAYLFQTPGFYKATGSKIPRLAGARGILIPARDVEGRIVACVIRADDPGDRGRYRWLSAPSETIGCGPGSPAHVSLHTEPRVEVVRVTEGQLKADVATALTGILTIGLPGVSAWRTALPVLSELGARRVLLAFDVDARRNKQVARSLSRIASELAAAGYEVAVEIWPDDAGKGIDDVLATGRGGQIETHDGRAAWERISEISATAGAGKVPAAAARVELDGLIERIEGDAPQAFAAEVIEAASRLEEETPEFQRLRASLKVLKVPIGTWDKAVRRARYEREQQALRGAPDSWRAALLHTDDGEVKRCIANTLTVLTRHPGWQGKLAFDAFAQVPVATGKLPMRRDDDPGDRESGDLTETDATRIAAWLGSEVGFEPSVEMVYQSVAVTAEKKQLHPVRDYLGGLEWDEQARLDTMLHRLFSTVDSVYTRAVGSRWMISAVARAYEPGCQVDCMLVLESVDQGIGKSRGLRELIGSDWFSDTRFEIGDKDAFQGLRRKWCHEFGELDSFKGRDQTRVKNFVSSPVDTYRPSFGRVARDFPRQIVFAGTTNEEHYFPDKSGNRRFWPVRCLGEVDRAGIAKERDQLWAEARVRYEKGERWHVDTPELRKLCEREQRKRETIDPWVEIVRKWLTNPTVPGATGYDSKPIKVDVDPFDGITTSDVLLGAIGMAAGQISHQHATRVGTVLKELDFWKKQKRVERGKVEPGKSDRVWVYYPPGVKPESIPDDDDVSDTQAAETPNQSSTSHPSHPYNHTHIREKVLPGENDNMLSGEGQLEKRGFPVVTCDTPDPEREAIQAEGTVDAPWEFNE